MSSPSLHDEHAHELVMPFVVVASKGGPFDDAAFTAGWTCAQIREGLAHSGTQWTGTVRTAVLPQLDLIAMERGMAVQSEDAGNEWSFATIAPTEAVL